MDSLTNNQLPAVQETPGGEIGIRAAHDIFGESHGLTPEQVENLGRYITIERVRKYQEGFSDASNASPNRQLRGMDCAPRDGTPILARCKHEADPYFLEDGTLTIYGMHAESLTHVPDGWHVLVWGGEDMEYDEWQDRTLVLPPWWYRARSDFEEPANPVEWIPIPSGED